MTASAEHGLRGDQGLVRRVHDEIGLTREWARRDFNARYRQSGLRSTWTIIQPMSLVVVYGIVFRQILDIDGNGLPYLSVVVVGVVCFRYFSAGIGQVTTLVDNASVLSKVYFRREVLPMSTCMVALVDLAVGTLLMIAVAWIQGIPPAITLIALPIPLVVLVFFTTGVCLLVSTVAVFVRDVVHAMPTILQVLFFASPVMYTAARYPSGWATLSDLNPLAVVIESARDVTLRHAWPNWWLLAAHFVAAIGLFVGGLAYLRSIEHRIVDVA